MIGEIRDKQTVQIAIESALTGHLVLSTLHTNDAAGAITRLLDMNVEPFLINATLTGILAQRLVRLLCPHCKKEQKPTADEIACAKYHNFTLTKKFTAPGCINCFNLGHQGRTSIFELLIPTNDINNLIMHKASCEKIRQQAINDHMQTLAYHGLTKVNEGLISFEEFLIIVPTFK
jgi:type II secretory ATPase GspE/PulE/Tfp pilus assembly ATPase PilB-like protein